MEEKPNKDWLRRIQECEDEKVLKYLLKDFGDQKIIQNENGLKLLMGMLSNTRFCKEKLWSSFRNCE